MNVRANWKPSQMLAEDLAKTKREVDLIIGSESKMIEIGAKRALRSQQVYNTGTLWNSVLAVRAGAMRWIIGTPLDYAELQEKGATLTAAQLAAQLEKISGPPPTQSKGVIKKVSAGSYKWKERPYLIPAFKQAQVNIRKILNRLTNG